MAQALDTGIDLSEWLGFSTDFGIPTPRLNISFAGIYGLLSRVTAQNCALMDGGELYSCDSVVFCAPRACYSDAPTIQNVIKGIQHAPV